MNQASHYRIGIDLGGTKVEGVLMDGEARIVQRIRRATPTDYDGQIVVIAEIVAQLEQTIGGLKPTIGVGHPGTLVPATQRIKNANSLCLNGKPLQRDLEAALSRAVRLANDADCLAVSEARDGAAAGAAVVFAAILGTGVGGGWVINERPLAGPNRIAGEWGHNSLPWPRPEWDEVPGPAHWDGRHGAIESWLSGPGLAADHRRRHGGDARGEAIVAAALAGDVAAEDTLQRYEDRLARALATVINLADPEVIVLGGGLSQLARLYESVPKLWLRWVFSDTVTTRVVPALHGDSSGVRGAAWLWS